MVNNQLIQMEKSAQGNVCNCENCKSTHSTGFECQRIIRYPKPKLIWKSTTNYR